MDIIFRKSKDKKACCSIADATKAYGDRRGKLMMRRLAELRAAETLEMLRALPQARCHELTGDRAGQLSVDLDHPYRLIFEPAHEKRPKKDDGGLDWSRVTAIKVLGIEDTHG